MRGDSSSVHAWRASAERGRRSGPLRGAPAARGAAWYSGVRCSDPRSAPEWHSRGTSHIGKSGCRPRRCTRPCSLRASVRSTRSKPRGVGCGDRGPCVGARPETAETWRPSRQRRSPSEGLLPTGCERCRFHQARPPVAAGMIRDARRRRGEATDPLRSMPIQSKACSSSECASHQAGRQRKAPINWMCSTSRGPCRFDWRRARAANRALQQVRRRRGEANDKACLIRRDRRPVTNGLRRPANDELRSVPNQSTAESACTLRG